MVLFQILSLVCLSILTACGSSGSSQTRTEGQIGPKTYLVTDEGSLVRTSEQLSGTGAVVFKTPLGAIYSKDNFVLTFSLSDLGSVELITHANADLENGVSVKLTRSSKELLLTVIDNGKETQSKTLSGFDASTTLSASIDVHNDEDPPHMLLWNGASTSFSEDTALFNSESDFSASAQAKGTFWGLKLTQAIVTAASVETAKFSEGSL